MKDLLTGQDVGTVVLNASGGFTAWGPVITIQPQGTALLGIDNTSWLPSFALSGTVKGHKEEGISGVQLVMNGTEEMTSGSDGGYSFPT